MKGLKINDKYFDSFASAFKDLTNESVTALKTIGSISKMLTQSNQVDKSISLYIRAFRYFSFLDDPNKLEEVSLKEFIHHTVAISYDP